MTGPRPAREERSHATQGTQPRKVYPGHNIYPVNLAFLSESSNRGPSRNGCEARSGDHMRIVGIREAEAEGL